MMGELAVILAGGLGTRLSEETHLRPKPLVEIGGMPIIWHIMMHLSYHGIDEFLILCGHKGHLIKEFFVNYSVHRNDFTIDFCTGKIETHREQSKNWKVTMVDTGEATLTGGRLKRAQSYLSNRDRFLMTYGDGVGDIDIPRLFEFHQRHGLKATVTAVKPEGRFGALDLAGDKVRKFKEKPKGDNGWINGGFFVLSPKVIDLIDGDNVSWEDQPLENLSLQGELAAFRHHSFWQPMDTLRDKRFLEDLWSTGKAPWRTWHAE